jgi:2-dehydro-3-deoxyphosphogluconate aldolase/(4S)-4-hydroxy-2-oxoglutarate aldolase
MIKNKEAAIKAITDQGLLPLFYYEDAQVSLEIVRTLYRAGVRVFEYTNRGKQHLRILSLLKKRYKLKCRIYFLASEP